MIDVQSAVAGLFDLFSKPDWRWTESGSIVSKRNNKAIKLADAHTKTVIEYRRALSRCRTDADLARLERHWPGQRHAQLLAEGDPLLQGEVDALLLARQSDAQIARRCRLTPECIGWYERMFFAVRDSLQGEGWIWMMAVRTPASGIYDRDDLSTLWKALGFSMGHKVLDAVLAITHPDPKRRRQLDPLLEVLVRLTLACKTTKKEKEATQVMAAFVRVRQLAKHVDADMLNGASGPLYIDLMSAAWVDSILPADDVTALPAPEPALVELFLAVERLEQNMEVYASAPASH